MIPIKFYAILAVQISAACVLPAETAFAQEAAHSTGRRREDFNRNWWFHLGPQEGAEAADHDVSAWESVRLPHDWAIRGPFDESQPGSTGKLPWRGEGWYRKTFQVDDADVGKRFYLNFDGVMAFPKVYVNGELAGEWDYGYMAFQVDATPFIHPGQNTLAVHVNTRNHGSRWYPGAGIYRQVSLTITDPVHVANWGTFVTTPEVSNDSATVHVATTIENHSDAEVPTNVKVAVLDPDGQQVAIGSHESAVAAGGSREFSHTLSLDNPKRWDVTDPQLYVRRTSVSRGGEVVDSTDTTFGVRAFEFTANDGFHLNGRRVQIYGVNLHHDHGPLGAAFYPRAMQRQLEIMKDMGANCLRTSHNPPAAEVLNICDRMGIIVWDECFDKWDGTADRVGDGALSVIEHGKKQLTNLVNRDRNHPSVVVWSIGNEISNGGVSGRTPERVTALAEHTRSLDPTRPVGLGDHIPETADTTILDSLDLTGWNYGRRYARFRDAYPDKPIIYSESASTLSTRGYYELTFPRQKTQYSTTSHQVSSFDMNAPYWSDILDKEFKLMEDDRFVAGEIVWTGFDYLGEPTPFTREARSSFFGAVDLVGIPKDRFYLYRSYWRPKETTIHILPHWNWRSHEGEPVPVFVYTNGDTAELFLNGRSLGKRAKGQVPSAPVNAAANVKCSASSVAGDSSGASAAADGDPETGWRADDESAGQWLQVDLGSVQPVRYLEIEFENPTEKYGYHLKASTDATTWETIINKPAVNARGQRRRGGFGGFGGGRRVAENRKATHHVNAQARYLRIEFTGFEQGSRGSVRELAAYPSVVEPEYYHVTYQYRLRWNDVRYEPGELKVVAYKDGQPIGEAFMRTAGVPASLRLTPDRTELVASGEDLSYIRVEAFDTDGNPCPLADNLVHFDVKGPAVIAGICNGNPLSYEPFQDSEHRLFYGKAMLIAKAMEGTGGQIEVTATADGLERATASLGSAP